MHRFAVRPWQRCLPKVSALFVLAACVFPAQAAEPTGTSPSLLFFGPQKERDVAFDEGLAHVRRATQSTVTYVSSKGEFEGLMKEHTYDLVLCVDQEICRELGGELIPYILAGHPVATVATAGATATTAEGFDVRLFIDAVDIPVLALRLPTIWEFIEWLECRHWCTRTTQWGSQKRRDCDCACNKAANQRAAS